MISETKVCRGCGRELPNEHFISRWRNALSTHTKCKECRANGYKIAGNAKKRTELLPWELKY